MIAFRDWVGFCQTSAWRSRRCTCGPVPSLPPTASFESPLAGLGLCGRAPLCASALSLLPAASRVSPTSVSVAGLHVVPRGPRPGPAVFPAECSRGRGREGLLLGPQSPHGCTSDPLPWRTCSATAALWPVWKAGSVSPLKLFLFTMLPAILTPSPFCAEFKVTLLIREVLAGVLMGFCLMHRSPWKYHVFLSMNMDMSLWIRLYFLWAAFFGVMFSVRVLQIEFLLLNLFLSVFWCYCEWNYFLNFIFRLFVAST